MIYIMSLMITVSFYFYVMFPISIALLLDSFNKTIMALGSITDEPEAEKKVSFGQQISQIFVLRPWNALAERKKEREAEARMKSLQDE